MPGLEASPYYEFRLRQVVGRKHLKIEKYLVADDDRATHWQLVDDLVLQGGRRTRRLADHVCLVD